MWKEFKEFAFKGNVIDMAVGVVIGSAFGKIVTSLVNDIIMPIFGFILQGVDFTNLKIVLSGDAAIAYGSFIQQCVDFLIIAFCIFWAVKIINNAEKLNFLKKKEAETAEAAEEPPAPTEAELLTQIRDLLQEKNSEK